MTPNQRRGVGRLISELPVLEAWHGDCIGADAEFHALCQQRGIKLCLAPSTDESQRAFRSGYVEIREPAPPLERNHWLASVCTVLIAAPAQEREVLRSGTWATIRYARKLQKRIYLVSPAGAIYPYRQEQLIP